MDNKESSSKEANKKRKEKNIWYTTLRLDRNGFKVSTLPTSWKPAETLYIAYTVRGLAAAAVALSGTSPSPREKMLNHLPDGELDYKGRRKFFFQDLLKPVSFLVVTDQNQASVT